MLRFADFELDTTRRSLSRDGVPAPLGRRAVDVLCLLAERRGAPVHKSELFETVWAGRVVEEGNLAVQISSLRKLLGPQAIATVPGLGYQLTLSLQGEGRREGTPAPADAALDDPLPALAGPLFGRDGELARLKEELAAARVVSVVGAGGVGKTCMALAAAHAEAQRGLRDVVWIDLAGVADADQMLLEVAARLRVQDSGAGQRLDAITRHLGSRRVLLVLDNCEHLLDPVRQLIAAALVAAPDARWLLTTQAPLKTAAEQVLRLGALAVPTVDMTLAEALECGALALLAQRARAADHRFALTEETLRAAVEICRRLDGVALAIEMAASRLPWMGVSAVLDRLDRSLRLLSSGRQDAAHRHASLDAALRWSYELLSQLEQTVFRRLAPFRGGFSIETMQRVVADAAGAEHDGIDPWAALDALGALVERSLVQTTNDPSAPGSRYRLLESMRQFADDRLAEAGEAQAAAERHASAFAALADELMEERWTLSDDALRTRVEPDLDNLRAALDRAVNRHDATQAAALFDALGVAVIALGRPNEVTYWAPRLEAILTDASPLAAARILVGLASGPPRNSAPGRSLALNRRALAALPAEALPKERYHVLSVIAINAARLGALDEAAVALAEARALEGPDWPPMLRMHGLFGAAFIAHVEGDFGAALDRYREVMTLAVRAGHVQSANAAALNAIDAAVALGRLDEAVAAGAALVSRLRPAGNPYLLGFALGNFGGALLQLGRIDEGARACLEALPLLRPEQHVFWLFDHLAFLALKRGRPETALTLTAYGDAERAARGGVRDPWEQAVHRKVLAEAGSALTLAEQAAAAAAGATLKDDAADALARSLLLS